MQQSKDYLLREIEKLSLMLIGLIEKISGLSSHDKNDEIGEVNLALKAEFDLNISEICDMPTEAFQNQMADLHDTHLKHLAELLYRLVLKMDSSSIEQNYDTSKIAQKAILLIAILDEKSKTFSLERLEMREQMEGFIA